jgi:hypothetical protein
LLDRLPLRVKNVLAGAAFVLPWLGGALVVMAAVFALHSWNFVRTQQRASATVTEDVEVIVPKPCACECDLAEQPGELSCRV